MMIVAYKKSKLIYGTEFQPSDDCLFMPKPLIYGGRLTAKAALSVRLHLSKLDCAKHIIPAYKHVLQIVCLWCILSARISHRSIETVSVPHNQLSIAVIPSDSPKTMSVILCTGKCLPMASNPNSESAH